MLRYLPELSAHPTNEIRMNPWSIVFLVLALALIAAYVVERFFPDSPVTVGDCTCLRWKSLTEPSGYRVVRDMNCPVHTEG